MSGRLMMICSASTPSLRGAVFPADEPLDAQGHAQACALAGQLGRVDAAWTGPSLRARQTGDALQLHAVVEPVLRDIDLGRWTGHSLAEIAAAEPDAMRAWTTEPAAAPHGGETIAGVIERVRPWLDMCARDGRRGVAVTHAAVMRAAIILAIDAPPQSFWRIDIPPLCRVDLRANSGVWRLRSISA
jgi:broad specificity phosphatase PhoE